MSLVALAVLAAVAAESPSPARASGTSCSGPTTTNTFNGTYSDSDQNGTESGGPDGDGSYTLTLQWNDTVTGPIPGGGMSTGSGACFPSPDHATLTVNGSFSWTPPPGDTSQGPCSATISLAPVPDYDYALAIADTNQTTEGGQFTEASVSGGPPNEYGSNVLQSSDNTCLNLLYGVPEFMANPPAATGDPNYSGTAPTGDAWFGGGYALPYLETPFDEDGQPTEPMTHTWSFSDSGSDGDGGTDTASGTDTLSYNVATTCQSGDASSRRSSSHELPSVKRASSSCGAYVALGDSYSSGQMKPPAPSTPPKCFDSKLAYPYVYDTAVLFAACGGATTADIEHGNNKGQPNQLSDLTSHTKLVTVTAGGDDLNLFGIMIHCVLYGVNPTHCRHELGLSLHSRSTSLARVQRNLIGLYKAIRQKLTKVKATGVQIYVLGYPNPLPQVVPDDCVRSLRLWETGGLLGVRREDAGLFWSVINKLNARIRAATRTAGVNYIAPFTGHNICSRNLDGQPDSYFFPLGNNAVTFHPNKEGQATMAMLLRAKQPHAPS